MVWCASKGLQEMVDPNSTDYWQGVRRNQSCWRHRTNPRVGERGGRNRAGEADCGWSGRVGGWGWAITSRLTADAARGCATMLQGAAGHSSVGRRPLSLPSPVTIAPMPLLILYRCSCCITFAPEETKHVDGLSIFFTSWKRKNRFFWAQCLSSNDSWK